jgi:hypothetical protein
MLIDLFRMMFMDQGAFEDEAESPLKGLKVLVIEPREITRRTLALILGASGADVTEAASEGEALAQLTVRRFDAILTDLPLPRLAGPNAGAPIVPITDDPAEALGVSHAAGMAVEIGGFLDPAKICAALSDLSPPPRAAAA